MQCCDDLLVRSYGGINDCHPYVLGEYRRIGQCGGRSFYQHKNNTDIFIYYVCGAWYVGLQVKFQFKLLNDSIKDQFMHCTCLVNNFI